MVYDWRLRYAPYSSSLPTAHNFGRQTWRGEHWKAERLCVKCLSLRGLVHPRACLEEEEEAKEGTRLVGLVGLRTVVLLCLVPLDKVISWGHLCVCHYLIRQMTFFHKVFCEKNPLHKEEKIQSLSLRLFTCFFSSLALKWRKPTILMGGEKKSKGLDLQSGGTFIREPGVEERSFNSNARNAKEFSEVVHGWKYLLYSHATSWRPT